MTLLTEVYGVAIQREMVPIGNMSCSMELKILFGIESINALPALPCSDEALMQLVGFNRYSLC